MGGMDMSSMMGGMSGMGGPDSDDDDDGLFFVFSLASSVLSPHAVLVWCAICSLTRDLAVWLQQPFRDLRRRVAMVAMGTRMGILTPTGVRRALVTAPRSKKLTSHVCVRRRRMRKSRSAT